MANLLVSDIIKMAEKQLNDAGIDEAKQQAEQIYCLMKNFDKMRFFMQWSKEAGEIEAENYFKLEGCEYVLVDVFAYNEKAYKFYKDKGYFNLGEKVIIR